MPLQAADIMTADVITAAPDETVAQIARRLADHHISAVPVCDANGAVLGMLTEGDLLRSFAAETEAGSAWWLHRLAESTEQTLAFLSYVRADQRRARDLMSRSVVSVTETTPAREIARLMTDHQIRRVPVVRDGRLVGIVARADLIGAIARQPDMLGEPN